MHISIIIYSVYACLCKFCWHYYTQIITMHLLLFLLCTAELHSTTQPAGTSLLRGSQWVPKAVGSDTDLACSANKYISSVSISPFLILPNPFLPSLPVCHSFLFRNVVHTATKLQQCRVLSVKCSPYCSDEWLFILDHVFSALWYHR